MKKILVVLGSARKGRAADKIAEFVSSELTTLGAEPVIADLKEINMPFFNSPKPPLAEDYTIQEDSVRVWSELVKESDGVVLLTPEYNHGTTGLLKNAIDWLSSEWTDKPVAIVGYGWGGATYAIPSVIESVGYLKANVQKETASLTFMKTVGVEGEPMGEETTSIIKPVLTQLL